MNGANSGSLRGKLWVSARALAAWARKQLWKEAGLLVLTLNSVLVLVPTLVLVLALAVLLATGSAILPAHAQPLRPLNHPLLLLLPLL